MNSVKLEIIEKIKIENKLKASNLKAVYRICSNKRHGRLFNLELKVRHLLKGGAKKRETIISKKDDLFI